MTNELAKLFADIAEGCYQSARVYEQEARKGLRGAAEMATKLLADGDRNWQKANAIDPAKYPMVKP
jgi:hypothetical protein